MVFAGEVNAGVELRGTRIASEGRGAEGLDGAGFGGEFAFGGFDELIWEEDGGVVAEFAEVLLGPSFGVVEAGCEFGGVDGKAGGDGVVDGDAGAEVERILNTRERR